MAKKKPKAKLAPEIVAADIRKMAGKPAAAYEAVRGWEALDPAAVADAVKAAWPSIRKPADRQQLMKAMFHARHPAALDALDLGMGDRDAKVKSWAAEFVAGISFRDFRKDPRGYASWRSATRNQDLDAVLRAGARNYVDRLSKTPRADRADASRGLFDAVRSGNLLPLAEAGLVRLLEEWIAGGDAEIAENALRVLHRFPGPLPDVERRLSGWIGSREDALARAVLKHVPEFGVGPEFLRAEILPIIHSRPALRAAALRALGQKGASWALEFLIPFVSDSDDDVVLAAAEALAEIGDLRAVPAMVEALKADPTLGRIYNLGNFGLEPLTGIEYDPSHDGAWWEAKLFTKIRPFKRGPRR